MKKVTADQVLGLKQLDILLHSLGLDSAGQGQSYRNCFMTDPTSEEGLICQQLVALKLMKDYGPQEMYGGMHRYRVTDEGKLAVERRSLKQTRSTKARHQ